MSHEYIDPVIRDRIITEVFGTDTDIVQHLTNRWNERQSGPSPMPPLVENYWDVIPASVPAKSEVAEASGLEEPIFDRVSVYVNETIAEEFAGQIWPDFAAINSVELSSDDLNRVMTLLAQWTEYLTGQMAIVQAQQISLVNRQKMLIRKLSLAVDEDVAVNRRKLIVADDPLVSKMETWIATHKADIDWLKGEIDSLRGIYSALSRSLTERISERSFGAMAGYGEGKRIYKQNGAARSTVAKVISGRRKK